MTASSSTSVDSAGVLLVRPGSGAVLAGHLGGPFWARKHEGAWSVPKGLVEPGESHWAAAQREFGEETGLPFPAGDPVDLGTARQGVKTLHLWRLEGDLDLRGFSPGLFDLEWPPRSGRVQRFPEIDRLEWLAPDDAERLLAKAQRQFLHRTGVQG